MTDPCDDSKNVSTVLTTLARDTVFYKARTILTKAAIDGKEHSIVFGKDAAANNILSAVRSAGLTNTSSIEQNFQGAFADMHNHPANTVPSTGDIYNLIGINIKAPLHTSRITVLANGTVYAIAIFNNAQALTFVKNYPLEQANGFSPGLPEKLFNEFADLKSYLINIQRIEKTLADEMATAFILDKYESGIALFRLLDDRSFARVYITQQKSGDGTAFYQAHLCK